MLSRNELEKNGPPNFKLGQKEKDYIQHWILTFLSEKGFNAVFKGGTCLQKVYALPRYSEDLDFTTLNGDINIEELTRFLAESGIEATFKKKDKLNSTTYKLRCHGPLYNGTTVSESAIVLEISKREKVQLNPNSVTINPPYADLTAYQVLAMDLKEMAAEKIRALYTRESPRDLYDLYFLLKRNATPDLQLINQKLEIYKKQFDKSEFKKRIKQLETKWAEIKTLTAHFIDYQIVSLEVLKKLSY